MKETLTNAIAGLLGRIGKFRFRLRLKRQRENALFEVETDLSVMEGQTEPRG